MGLWAAEVFKGQSNALATTLSRNGSIATLINSMKYVYALLFVCWLSKLDSIRLGAAFRVNNYTIVYTSWHSQYWNSTYNLVYEVYESGFKKSVAMKLKKGSRKMWPIQNDRIHFSCIKNSYDHNTNEYWKKIDEEVK